MKLSKNFTLKRIINYFFLALAHLPISGSWRWRLVKLGGVDIKGKCYIYKRVTFDTVAPQHIHIEKGVTITEGAMILTHYLTPSIPGRNFRIGDVYIEKDVFIGAGTIICNDITISEGAIIGAGSVVTKNIPPYQVWAGNPAKFIKERAR